MMRWIRLFGHEILPLNFLVFESYAVVSEITARLSQHRLHPVYAPILHPKMCLCPPSKFAARPVCMRTRLERRRLGQNCQLLSAFPRYCFVRCKKQRVFHPAQVRWPSALLSRRPFAEHLWTRPMRVGILASGLVLREPPLLPRLLQLPVLEQQSLQFAPGKPRTRPPSSIRATAS